MQLSMRACLLNLLPFLLYGVIMFGLLVAALRRCSRAWCCGCRWP